MPITTTVSIVTTPGKDINGLFPAELVEPAEVRQAGWIQHDSTPESPDQDVAFSATIHPLRLLDRRACVAVRMHYAGGVHSQRLQSWPQLCRPADASGGKMDRPPGKRRAANSGRPESVVDGLHGPRPR